MISRPVGRKAVLFFSFLCARTKKKWTFYFGKTFFFYEIKSCFFSRWLFLWMQSQNKSCFLLSEPFFFHMMCIWFWCIYFLINCQTSKQWSNNFYFFSFYPNRVYLICQEFFWNSLFLKMHVKAVQEGKKRLCEGEKSHLSWIGSKMICKFCL